MCVDLLKIVCTHAEKYPSDRRKRTTVPINASEFLLHAVNHGNVATEIDMQRNEKIWWATYATHERLESRLQIQIGTYLWHTMERWLFRTEYPLAVSNRVSAFLQQ